MNVHLGFEVPTGEPVEVPVAHIAVTGQTQASGKTTTLEALVARSELTAIAFVTKRGEGGFSTGRRISPYFRDRADWQFVSSIIDATLQEKNKFLRPWIMKICRNTHTLAEVQREIRTALQTAKGIHQGVYTQLDAYLDLIVPDISRIPFSHGLDLRPGLNVMDVAGYSTPMQMLFVQSAIDWVNKNCTATIVVVPEAWEFVPEGKSSPVKASAIDLVRKGAGLKNFIWVDSQDMAGVDKTILRGCATWLIGVQREANEIKRNLANIPANIQHPKAADIAKLDKGQFYACWKDRVVKVYVQPAWMKQWDAILIAKGNWQVEDAKKPQPVMEEEPMSKALEEKMDRMLDLLATQQGVAATATPATATVRDLAPSQNGHGDEEALYQRFKARLAKESPAIIRMLGERPELEITFERKTVEVDATSARGMIAMLLKEGFLDQPTTATNVWKELKRRWSYGGISARCYEQLDQLNAMGFVTKEADGYQAVKDMKINVIKK